MAASFITRRGCPHIFPAVTSLQPEQGGVKWPVLQQPWFQLSWSTAASSTAPAGKVYNILKKDGYNVTIVQNPTTSLADDVAVTKRAIAQQDGPVVLVGHSYGGVVVSEAGTDPKVAGAWSTSRRSRPDKGESVRR